MAVRTIWSRVVIVSGSSRIRWCVPNTTLKTAVTVANRVSPGLNVDNTAPTSPGGGRRRRRGVSTVVNATPALVASKRAAGAIAVSLATATAVVTVLVYSVALARHDLGLGTEGRV